MRIVWSVDDVQVVQPEKAAELLVGLQETITGVANEMIGEAVAQLLEDKKLKDQFEIRRFTECCPHCDRETEIYGFMPDVCDCGKVILPCAVCDVNCDWTEGVGCQKYPHINVDEPVTVITTYRDLSDVSDDVRDLLDESPLVCFMITKKNLEKYLDGDTVDIFIITYTYDSAEQIYYAAKANGDVLYEGYPSSELDLYVRGDDPLKNVTRARDCQSYQPVEGGVAYCEEKKAACTGC
jgi:hypothetical protein